MRFANPAALALLALAIPIIAVHVLRPQRRERIVGSTMIWQRMDRPVSSTIPWQRLRPSWLLAAQLLALTAIAVGLANPQRVTPAELAEHSVFLIDASASMAALDGEPDRLAEARRVAIERRRELPAGGVASVIEVGAVPKVLLTQSADADEFSQAVASVSAGAGAADFASAFALAEGLETPESPIGFVLVGDGGLSDEELRQVPPGLAYEAVGSKSENRGIAGLDLLPGADGITARTTLINAGDQAITQRVRFDVDGVSVQVAEVELDRGETAVVAVELPAGDRVEAFLDSDDLLLTDDRAWAVPTRRAALDVGVVGARDPFLATALGAIDGIEVTLADEFDPDHLHDVVIFDRAAVPDDPAAPFVALAAPGGLDQVSVAGQVDAPVVTLVRSSDPLLVNLDLGDLAIADAQRLRVGPLTQTLVGAESAPLIVRGRHGDHDYVATAFELSRSNLPLQLAFPILLDRLVGELGASSLPPAGLTVGDRVGRTGSAARITDPEGRVVEVPAGALAPRADRPGFWTIQVTGQPAQTVAVNPDPRESRLAPAAAIPSALRPGAEPEAQTSADSLRNWLLAAALAVLAAEYLLARRRVGVGRRQWRVSVALRALVALALLAALFQPTWSRPTDRVATVFLIDASDSVGASGRAESVAWVGEALDTAPDDAAAGVVVFGGDARIESLVEADPALAATTVVVDPTRTDLAAALRLGAAILPTDARRRVVLVSDGRPTTGEVGAEADRLAAAGIAVDTRIVGASSDVDAAVVAVDAPSTVSTGAAVAVRATAGVRGADAVVLELVRGDQVVASVQAPVVDGQATARLVDPTPAAGSLLRYGVRVIAVGDTVDENDLAIVPVQVDSARGVLVIEGSAEGTNAMASTLEASGLDVTVADPSALSTIDELVRYEAIVLVDVDRLDMSESQIQALSGAVRDAGRGLVTVGGTSSYALGAYLGSELERLLPVISDILDPQRRQTVAEVLAIDTSGSMGTCHCAEGQMAASRLNSGVDKTDVARAAAARTISALGSTDEIGLISFDDTDRWVIDLAPVPDTETVNDALGTLSPRGGTDIRTTLNTAAEQLRTSSAALKHVILFSDGFTEPGALAEAADDAASLLEEGITVSVVATGEGAAEDLRAIAEAGGGRFYAGRNLTRIPEIILEEALLASRDYVNEGEFFPAVTSRDSVVAALDASPPLLGYQATTAKPTAETLLRIGPDADPLLATWRVGLGRVTSWTSDGGERWAQQWAGWGGGVDFWNRVVSDTFPSHDGDVATTATVDGDVLRIEVDSAAAFGDDAAGVARITEADGSSREVPLDRISDTTYGAEVTLEQAGIVAVGTSIVGEDTEIVGTALTSRSYGDEYRLGGPDPELLARVAATTGGRAEIAADDAFDVTDLAAASTRVDLTPWLLWFAVLAWPAAVVMSRWRRRHGPLPDPDADLAAPAWTGRSLRQSSAPAPAVSEPAGSSTASSAGVSVKVADPPAPEPAASPAGRSLSEPTWSPERALSAESPMPTDTDPAGATEGSALDALLKAQRDRRNR